ncbi:hypothetical protein ACH5RR_000690 [Cinchona calisaya]|uniref:Uncharacterized protein n=1 Tax=Cinchona calisaya TaxID=153742 RepID=A0ABD3B1H2_9GENT
MLRQVNDGYKGAAKQSRQSKIEGGFDQEICQAEYVVLSNWCAKNVVATNENAESVKSKEIEETYEKNVQNGAHKEKAKAGTATDNLIDNTSPKDAKGTNEASSSDQTMDIFELFGLTKAQIEFFPNLVLSKEDLNISLSEMGTLVQIQATNATLEPPSGHKEKGKLI